MLALGIVSNCFKTQLDAGASLADMISAAVQRGYRVIELRQTCLGEFEIGDPPLPQARLLEVLAEFHPGVRFDVAIAVPFLQSGFSRDDVVFDAGRWAAQAVAGEYPPHLRLVDPQSIRLDASPTIVGREIAQLTRAMIELDGILSIEQSRQPWHDFRAMFDAARKELGRDAMKLRLCYDPCNLLNPGDDIDAATVTASLTPDEISMVHAKQRSGRPLPAVTVGDIDWAEQAAALKEIGYAGPLLFEIEPHEDVWENLKASHEYLREVGFDLAET